MNELERNELMNGKFKDLRFNWYSEKCPYEQYIKYIDESKFVRGDYGKWVNFYDSFPPLPNEDDTIIDIEILYYGNVYLESIFSCEPDPLYCPPSEPKTVWFQRYDDNQWIWENFFCSEHEMYWRFIPEPPGNEAYDVG